MSYEKLLEQLTNEGKYNTALTLSKKQLLKNKNPEKRIKIYLIISSILRRKNNPRAALQFLKKAEKLAIYEEEFAEILCEKALIFRMLLKYREAVNHIRKARKIYKKIKDKNGIAYSYWIEGGIKRYWGRSQEGLILFKKSYSLFKKIKDKVAESYSLCGIGGTYRICGKFKESLKNYRKANFIFKKFKDKFGLAYSYCGTGSAFRMLNRFKSSEENYKKAIQLYKEIKDDWNMAYSLWGYTMLLQKNGYLKNFSYMFKKLDKIFEKYNDKRGILYVNFLKINLNINQKNFRKAKKLIYISEKIINELELKDEKKFLLKFKNLIKRRKNNILLIP